MIYTTVYINKVLSAAYCCIGTLTDSINMKMVSGMDYKCEETKARKTFLYTVALSNYSQSDDGLTPDPDNVLSVEQRDKIIEDIFKNCGCMNEATQSVINLDNDYWSNGYTLDDTGDDSYNG